jgi:hypothetical protein
VRAREPELLQQLELVGALAAGFAQRRERLGERRLGARVVGLAHRPVAAQRMELRSEVRRRPQPLERLSREALEALGAAEVALAQQLGGAAQVGVEAVRHLGGGRYATRSAPL